MAVGFALAGLFIASTGYFMLGIRKTVAVGPAPEGMLGLMLFGQIWLQHGLAAGLAASAGFALIAPYLIFVDIVPAALVGILVGYAWGRLRMRSAEIRNAGPDSSVPEDKLFPSDRLARLLHEGFAKPLPMYIDISILLLCVCVGGLAGLGLGALLPM